MVRKAAIITGITSALMLLGLVLLMGTYLAVLVTVGQ